RVSDALRRACRALEREPRVIAAMMTAMSSPDEANAPMKREVDATLRAIITEAIADGGGDDVDDIVSVLGAVWFAGLSHWVNGLSGPGQMADDLERAAQLLLRAPTAVPHR